MKPRRGSNWSRVSLFALAIAACSSALAAPEQAAPQPQLQEALLSVTLNGVSNPAPLALLRGTGGQIYATAQQLRAWRIDNSTLPQITRAGRRYYLVNGIAGAVLKCDEAAQELSLTVPANALQRTRISYAPTLISDEVVAGSGAYLNYDVDVENSGGRTAASAAIEAVVFTPRGFGTATFVGRGGSNDAGLVRLETNWTVNDPSRMRSLRLGDSISVAGPGGRPVRFAGLQLARNFAEQPGFVTFPLPSMHGSAELPSTVDVYVNDRLLRRSDLPPGPFDLTDIPVVTGSGQVQLVVHDMLGRQQLVTQPYYASLGQLRHGLDEYSYEVGFLRRDFGERSDHYGSLFFSGTHRYGFSDAFTAGAHVEVTPSVQQAAIGGSVVIGTLGDVQASLSASHSGSGNGVFGSVTLERRTRGVSLGVHAELSSRSFATVGTLDSKPAPQSLVQAFAGIPLDGSSLGLSYLRRAGRGEPTIEMASANWSLRLPKLGSLNLAVRTDLSGPRNNAAELILIVPLGMRTSASAAAEVDNGGATFNAGLQRSAPAGSGLGYTFNAAAGRFERVHATVTLRTDFGEYDGLLTWTDGRTGVRLSTAGSIGLVGGDSFASRRLDQSFARVKVGGYAGVKVYADNQLIGRTGKDGSIIVPNLRPFDNNAVRIDIKDLPLDAELSLDGATVRPNDRSGVVVEFPAKPARAAHVRVILEDGSALPEGSTVRLRGRPDEFVAASGGEVYLTEVDPGEIATADWAKGSCRFAVQLTPGDMPRDLPVVQCGRSPQ